MSSKESLATLSYLSSGFLSLEDEPTLQTTKLSVQKVAVVEDELEDVNKYVTLLKSFINNGPDAFASVEDQESDRPEYDYLLNMSVNDNEFKLYYNVNIESREINGIFIIDGVEYEIIASSNLDDFEDFDQVTTEEPATEEATTEEATTEEVTTGEVTTEDDVVTDETAGATGTSTLLSEDYDDDDDEAEELDDEDDEDEIDDEDENEVKKEMSLVAKNGEDTITIKYEFKLEDYEEKTEFEIIKNINGVESIIEVEIKIEEDEYKLEILDGNNSYEFSMETEDDEVEYELEYLVNGVEGEIQINEYTDENGNVFYEYEIEEEGNQSVVEKEDDFDSEYDDEEYDDEEYDDEDYEDEDEDDDENDDEEITEEATI